MTPTRPDRWWEKAFTSYQWKRYLEKEKLAELEELTKPK